VKVRDFLLRGEVTSEWPVNREFASAIRGCVGLLRPKKSDFADPNNRNGVIKLTALFFRRSQARSKRSRFITLVHAATKSATHFSCASAEP